jgi:hypothetical protein
LRGDLEAQPDSGSFAPKKRDLCVEERLLSKLSRYETAIRPVSKPPKTADVQFLRPEDRLNDVTDGPS